MRPGDRDRVWSSGGEEGKSVNFRRHVWLASRFGSTYTFNPKAFPALMLSIDCFDLGPVMRPWLTKLLAMGPVGHQAAIPIQLVRPVCMQQGFHIWELVEFVFFGLEGLFNDF